MYKITEYSKQKASQLGVQIKPSSNPKKKLDVFKNKNKIASIGDIKSKDYPTYLKDNKILAEERRRLYKLRHHKDRRVIGSNGYYADKILW
jgi:hypothetical protein